MIIYKIIENNIKQLIQFVINILELRIHVHLILRVQREAREEYFLLK